MARLISGKTDFKTICQILKTFGKRIIDKNIIININVTVSKYRKS